MVLKQNDDALTERWCSNRTTILKQNDGAQTERWCSNRTMIFKQNDDAQTERWCYNYKNDGVLTERWCSNRTMVLLFPTPPHPTRKREKPAPEKLDIFLGVHMRGNPCVVVLGLTTRVSLFILGQICPQLIFSKLSMFGQTERLILIERWFK